MERYEKADGAAIRGREAMADPCRKLIRVLSAELEDLMEDIGLVEKRVEERFSAEEITENVFRENDSVLRHEVEGLKTLRDFIDGIDVSLYKSVTELADVLDARVRDMVLEHEDPEAIYGFFTRKLRKAERYVCCDD